MRPFVAITCDRRAEGPVVSAPGRVRPARPEVHLGEAVVNRVRQAGGIAVLLPPGDAEGATDLLDRAHALIVTGGAFDIHPRHYGADVSARLDRVDEDRTALELHVCRVAMQRRIPVLGLCGGMQALVVAAGGTLDQHVDGHEQPSDPATAWHALVVEPGAPADRIRLFGRDSNSTHHQAVARPGPFRILARAPDGVIEAIDLPGHPFCVGVQGHPELRDGACFAALVAAARDHAALESAARSTRRPQIGSRSPQSRTR